MRMAAAAVAFGLAVSTVHSGCSMLQPKAFARSRIMEYSALKEACSKSEGRRGRGRETKSHVLKIQR